MSHTESSIGSSGSIVVTGDWGNGVITRYTPADVAQPQMRIYPKAAHDVSIPSGAAFLSTGLRVLLPELSHRIVSELPAEATLKETLSSLELKKWHGGSVLRVAQVIPLVEILSASPRHVAPPIDPTLRISTLVIHDTTADWWSAGGGEPHLSTIARAVSCGANIIVNIGSMLNTNHTEPPDRSQHNTAWERIRQYHRSSGKVTIVCSASPLRQAGAAVSRRLSWEQTIEDFMVDLKTFVPLTTLADSGRLIVRFGFVGCLVHDRAQSPADKAPTQLVFAPNAKDGTFRDDVDDGGILGKNLLTIASIVDRIERQGGQKSDADFVEAARTGLMLAMDVFDKGMPCPTGNKHGAFQTPWFGVGAETRAKEAAVESRDAGIGVDDIRLPGAAYIREYLTSHAFRHGSPVSRSAMGYSSCSEANSGQKIASDRVLGTVMVPDAIVDVQPGIRPVFGQQFRDTEWQILRQVLSGSGTAIVEMPSSALRINLGMAIVKFGHEMVLNCPLPGSTSPAGAFRELYNTLTMDRVRDQDYEDFLPLPPGQILTIPGESKSTGETTAAKKSEPVKLKPIFVPLVCFADLVAIERREAESIRAIRNLFRSYVESTAPTQTQRRPISVAVFGPPGSGKSFAVKQLADSIGKGDSKKIEVIECNVAQFRDLNDVENVFLRCANANVERRIPLVFFDEFDCEHNGSPLGWLKYFLAPMQDGTFYGANRTISCGRAIFVFAGGVNSSFEKFDPWTSGRNRDAAHSATAVITEEMFKACKGPDFVSRLRGYINIMSVNPDESGPKDESGRAIKPIIRRAIMLRGHIRKAGLLSESDGISVANVDDDIIFALLTIDSYRHGQRSMEAVLQMCSPIGGRIAIASLPSRAQLKMHVDADEFYTRVLRGRSRKQLQHANASSSGSNPNPLPADTEKSTVQSDAVAGIATAATGTPQPKQRPDGVPGGNAASGGASS